MSSAGPSGREPSQIDEKGVPERSRELFGRHLASPPHDGPFWIRPQALRQDPIDPEIVQIVGHTQREEISNDDNVFVIDTLPREFLILEDGEFIIERVYSK